MTFAFFLIAVFALVIPFIAHLILRRIFRLFREREKRQKGPLLSSLLGMIVLPVLFFLWTVNFKIYSRQELVLSGAYLLLIYGLSAYIYFHLFNMSETARRVKILALLAGGGLAPEELERHYSDQGAISIRLARLIALGQLRLDNGRYFLQDRSLLPFIKFAWGLRRIIFSQPCL